MLNEQKSELRAELEDAFNKAGIGDYVVVNATAIIEKIKKNYVSGNPRAWWLSLKNKIDTIKTNLPRKPKIKFLLHPTSTPSTKISFQSTR